MIQWKSTQSEATETRFNLKHSQQKLTRLLHQKASKEIHKVLTSATPNADMKTLMIVMRRIATVMRLLILSALQISSSFLTSYLELNTRPIPTNT